MTDPVASEASVVPEVLAAPEGTRFNEVRWFDVIDSTNRYLVHLANEGESGPLVVAAGHQTNGRGRRGRVWDSKPGASLLFSVLLRPSRGATPTSLVQALGLAVVDACSLAAGFEAGLKWPNDVVVGDRKLAGILAEAVTIDGDVRSLVVGCGINLAWGDDLPDALTEVAASVDREGGRTVEARTFLDAILRAFDQRLAHLDWIPDAYRSRCSTIGRSVRVERDADTLVGTAIDVDETGALVVEDPSGMRHTVMVGDVVHVRPGN